MREIQFSGVVNANAGGLHWSPTIDGRDIIEELEKFWPYKAYSKPVLKVFLGTQPDPHHGIEVTGEFWSCGGFAGTEVTPPDIPEITVGGTDIFAKLSDHDGEIVLLIVEGP